MRLASRSRNGTTRLLESVIIMLTTYPGFLCGHPVLREMPGREDPRTLARDGDRELEVGGQRAVLGVDRPAIVAHPHVMATRGRHRLDGEHHALLEQLALAGRAVVGDLRVLVHVAADPVADQRAHYREAVLLHVLLDSVADVAEAVAGHALLGGLEQRLARDFEQLGGH